MKTQGTPEQGGQEGRLPPEKNISVDLPFLQ